jgi:hypothetical protein
MAARQEVSPQQFLRHELKTIKQAKQEGTIKRTDYLALKTMIKQDFKEQQFQKKQ